ncbi:MAG TPA: HNH endonuclease [Cyclobacteriaceae bacterium]|jgi:hypothetical protein|nr:HNH endonuclease [Cyclobacteriaceae bacterium]
MENDTNRKYKCIFCLKDDVPFNRTEHIIPESLGNDELIVEKGFVCDECNSYFGVKVEKDALNYPPLITSRMGAAVKTKKRRLPQVKYGDMTFFSTGYLDQVGMLGPLTEIEKIQQTGMYIVNEPLQSSLSMARLLLKMGLEFLTLSTRSPYEACFDEARSFSRYAPKGRSWEFATHSQVASRESLIISTRFDDDRGTVSHALFEPSLMVNQHNQEVAHCFVYRTHGFIINLSNPLIDDTLKYAYTSSGNMLYKVVVKS